MDNCERAVLFVTRPDIEGGFVWHPRDPGGATNMGVTLATLQDVGLDVDGDGDVDVDDIRKLRKEDTFAIYRRRYWDKLKCDALPWPVAMFTFDCGVNSGTARAARWLQQAVNTTRDGVIGPQTIGAVDMHDARSVAEDMATIRRNFVRSLSTYTTFGRGWERRITAVLTEALEL